MGQGIGTKTAWSGLGKDPTLGKTNYCMFSSCNYITSCNESDVSMSHLQNDCWSQTGH